MLLFDPNKKSLGFVPPTPEDAAKKSFPFGNLSLLTVFGSIDFSKGKEEAILPKDGKKVLDAQESPATQKTPEAQALIESLLTADCKVAIRDAALNKYAAGLITLVAVDKKAKEKKLADFTSQLRAWPAAAQAFWATTNERDNDANRQAVSDFQTAAASKMVVGCPYLNDVSKFAQQSDMVKKAEVDLLKAQCVNGGGAFPLSEWHPDGENSSQICWFGPVAVRTRVATKEQNSNKETVYTFPIPPMMLWYGSGSVRNPQWVAVAPCYTDYIPPAWYFADGKISADPDDWDTYWLQTTGSWAGELVGWNLPGGGSSINFPPDGAYLYFDDFISEQIQRIYGVDVPPFTGFVGGNTPKASPEPKKIVPNQMVTMNPYMDLVHFSAVGRILDPEWGGVESENYVEDHTVHEIYNALVPALRQRQDERRLVLKSPNQGKTITFGDTNAGEYYKLMNKIRAAEEGVSTAALFPPVRTKLKYVPNSPLPPHSFQEWSGMAKGGVVLED